MKYFLFLLLLLACNEPDKCDMARTRSDATPLQFYPIGEDSFNRENEGYTDDYCFNQKFLCTSTIRDQFTETTFDSDYTLVGYDENGSQLFNEEYVRTNIFTTDSDIDFLNQTFTSNITGWTNYTEAAKKSWVHGTVGPVAVAQCSGTTEPDSQQLYATRGANGIGDYNKFPSGTYRFKLNAHNNSSGGSGPLTESLVMRAFDVAGGANESATLASNARGGGFLDYEIELVTTQEWSYISFAWEKDGTKTSSVINVFVNSIEILEYPLDYTISRYDIDFDPSDNSMCDKLVDFKITNGFEGIENGSFEGTISPATSTGVGNAWSWFSNSARVTLPSSVSQTQVLNIPFNALSGNTYDFILEVDILVGAGSAGSSSRIVILFTDGVSLTDIYDSGLLGIGHHTLNISMPATSNWTSIQIVGASTASSSYGRIVDLNSIECITDGLVEYEYTDKIHFVTTWANGTSSGKVEIQYKSVINFADLIYDEDSPYFIIQLDGRFRKTKQVTTQKTLELTEKVINTAATLKNQKKLTINDVPDYMHRKINLILAHAVSGTVLVNGMSISVEEGYEEGDRPETYPLTPAEIYLTERNFYKHNVT